MKVDFTEEQLAAFLAGRLQPRERERLEAALQQSSAFRARLARVKQEQETVEAVRDSFAIRLPEADEGRIISNSLGRLGATLGGSEP